MYQIQITMTDSKNQCKLMYKKPSRPLNECYVSQDFTAITCKPTQYKSLTTVQKLKVELEATCKRLADHLNTQYNIIRTYKVEIIEV